MPKGMKRLRTLSVFFLIFFFCSIFCSPTFAYIPEKTFDELVHLADIIFVGTVADKTPGISKNRRIVETRVTFDNIQMIHQKDTAVQKTGKQINLTYAGGRFNEVYTQVGDMPRLEKNQRYLVFAYYDGQIHTNPFVGGEQGLFKVAADETTGTQYPLKIGGSGIRSIQDGKFMLTPPLKKIDRGLPELAESRTKIKNAPPPQTPKDWPWPARTRTVEPPAEILNLSEMIDHIHKALEKSPSQAVIEKLSAKAASAMSRKNDPDTAVQTTKRPWEFSDDGKLVILDPARVNCRKPDKKTGNAIGRQSNRESSTLGGSTWDDIWIYGWHDLPVIMDMLPESYWTYNYDTQAMGTYNMYIDDLFEHRPWDGGFSYLNGWSEIYGFLTDAQHRDILSGGWDDAIAEAWRSGGNCEDCEIFETDIAFKAEENWTGDHSCQLFRNVEGLWDDACRYAFLYKSVAEHELGHALGLMNELGETYDYHVPTIMNGGLENVVEDGAGLHVGDTYLLRYWYADQRNDAAMNHDDIGIESWIADGGAKKSTTDKSSYNPGEQIWINNLTVENPGRHAAPTVRIRAYLDNNIDLYALLNEANELDLNKIPSNRLLIGPPPSNIYYDMSTVEHEAAWIGNLTFIIPQSMPSGLYRVHLVITANNDQSVLMPQPGDTSYHEMTAHNNHTFLYDQIEIVCPKPAAPANLIQQGTDASGVGLAWDAEPNAHYYKVLRNVADDAANAVVLSQTITTNSYKDTTAVPGVGYYYWVQVQSPCLSWSNATRLTANAVRPLQPPCIISATDGTSTAEVQVTAQRVDQGNYYRFYYSTGNPATAVPVDNKSWTSDSSILHTGGVPGTIYYYWAKAATSSDGANATALGGVCSDNMGWRKLSPPSGVFATTDLVDGIRITWSNPPGASAYMVYRNTENNSAGATPIMGGWSDQTSTYDSDVDAGRVYYYWVRAAAETNGLRPSDFSRFAVGSKAFSPAPKVELGSYGATKGTYSDKVTIEWNPILWPPGNLLLPGLQK